ncbi:MAG: hypothetical protein LUD27_00655 [Clostridia bacterium]|nr:hypothetical protein [Clostridia bacterium]
MAEEIKNTGLGIVVDDGYVRESIRNQYGEEIGVFCFRPSDLAMLERYNKVADGFADIVKPLEDVSIAADGSVDEQNEAAFKAMEEAKKRLFEACDYLFGGNMSEAFFGKMHPFSPVGGHFYCENVLNAVGKYISAYFNGETKRIQDRVNRYTRKYANKRK